MKSFITFASLGLGVSAAAIQKRQATNSCCFDIDISGGVTGPLGELWDGQCRVGPGFNATQFCIDDAGHITDAMGRGCRVIGKQWQCDTGVSGDSGHSIGYNGQISLNGNSTWWACAATADFQYNMYKEPVGPVGPGLQCLQISMSSHNMACAGSGCSSSSSSMSMASTIMSSIPVAVSSSSSTIGSSTPAPVISSSSSIFSSSPVPITSSSSTITSSIPIPVTSSSSSSVFSSSSTASSSSSIASSSSVSIIYSSSSVAPSSSSRSSIVPSSTPVSPVMSSTSVSGTSYTDKTSSIPATSQTSSVPIPTSSSSSSASSASSTTSSVVSSAAPLSPVMSSTISSVPITTSLRVPVVSSTYYPPSSNPIIVTPSISVTLSSSSPVASSSSTRFFSTEPIPIRTSSTRFFSTEPIPSRTMTTTCSTVAPVTQTVTHYTTITVGGCTASVSTTPVLLASSSTSTTSVSSASSSTSSTSSSATPSSTCPMELTGSWQYPHLIIPVDSASPTSAPGTQYFGHVSSTVSTIFNFDVPASYSGMTCSLIFALPLRSQLETSDYTTSGSGNVTFAQLAGPAGQSTSYANAPAAVTDLGAWSLASGSAITVATAPCSEIAGQVATYEMGATGGYKLDWFQDYNPCPLGLYIKAE